MKVYWNDYMIDERIRKYNDELINKLVLKFDGQERRRGEGKNSNDDEKEDGPAFNRTHIFEKRETERLLRAGNAAFITLWDSLRSEVSETLLNSCEVYTFVDDYMHLNYG